jgi:hypothetical protein
MEAKIVSHVRKLESGTNLDHVDPWRVCGDGAGRFGRGFLRGSLGGSSSRFSSNHLEQMKMCNERDGEGSREEVVVRGELGGNPKSCQQISLYLF